MTDLVPAEKVESVIISLRGERVILDRDLASFYGVQTKRLNEQVKRNIERFGEKYAFQLTTDEFKALRSQIATSNTGRGGRRYPPWAFTEHGVVMSATILDSEKAIEASKFLVDVFVDLKHRLAQTPADTDMIVRPSSDLSSPLERFAGFGKDIGHRLEMALEHVLDSVVDTKKKTTVREETQALISESIQHLKERLKKQGLENEQIAAHIVKLLAEAEKEKAVAAKTRAEADDLEFATIIKKLRLLLEAQRAFKHDSVDDFLDVLKNFND